MKILTLTGTRPELIRLSLIIKKLDDLCDHILVYTNQNYTPNLSDIFFRDLEIRKPDYTFFQANGLSDFLSIGFKELGTILEKEKPDKVLILGDTNSGLFSILAAKRGIPVYHMEAGNRCYDGEVPEETNRRVIDSCSTFNLPYTENSKQNLINERYHKNFVFKTGNPINEVLNHYMSRINESKILETLDLKFDQMSPDGGYITINKPYILLSFHRTENVDNPFRVKQVMEAMEELSTYMDVIYPVHPHSFDQFGKQGITIKGVRCIPPIGFFDFVQLEKQASVVITDSGTVPEETSLFGIPTIVLRDTTERQELMENGTLILAGTKKDDIIRAFHVVRSLPKTWKGLEDYDKLNVTDTVIRLLLGQSIQLTRRGHDEY
jgi:UDP-N-acetylglucosamine 2-epimerase (non-hydrolysing)